jgi:serine/threonine protein kinase
MSLKPIYIDNSSEQNGGKYLGRGTAGCIFRPHLKCVSLSNKKNSVGKVFVDKDEYENELEMVRIMERIDPNNEFTIPSLGTCNGIHYYRHNDEVSKCKTIINTINDKDNIDQIIYKYGGKSLYDVMNGLTTHQGSIKNFLKLMLLFKPILLGIQKFNNRSPSPNVVHLDIKPHNIMLLRSKMYLIDYGLLSAHDEVYNKNRLHILSSDYPWYPPEFKAFTFPPKADYDKLFERINDNFVKVEPKIGTAISTTLKMNPKKDFVSFFNTKLAKKDYINYADKIDIYSLGIVLLQLYLWSGYHKKVYSRPSKYHNIKLNVIELIKGMIQFDPRNRYNIEQVINKFNEISVLLDS